MNNTQQEIESASQTVRNWQRNPKQWVLDIFPKGVFDVSTTETGLSTQQEDALNKLGQLITAKLKKADNEKMSASEEETAKKIGLSIMSGTGTGKDFFAALVNLFFLHVFPYPKNTATANTGKQLKNVYWSELAKVMSLAKPSDPDNPNGPTILEDLFEWQSEKIFYKPLKGKRWFCEAVTVNPNGSEKEQNSTLSGRHEDYQLIIIDEASGIPDGVFTPLEGTLTRRLNIVLIIFNPTRSRGFAVESQDDDRFLSMRWNSEESELVSREHIETMAKKHGRDTNTYRVRVLGLPPNADDDSLIPFDWIMDAVERDIEPIDTDPIIKALDVGGGGEGNKSVIATRQGGFVFPFLRSSNADTMHIAGWAVQDAVDDGASILIIDSNGIGRGVYDNARKSNVRVRGVNNQSSARDPDRFVNIRAEMYWNLRQDFEEGLISIPDDSTLIDELGAIKYTEPKGMIQIVKKEKIKKELEGESPDNADALAMTKIYPDSMFARKHGAKKRGKKTGDSSGKGWMRA